MFRTFFQFIYAVLVLVSFIACLLIAFPVLFVAGLNDRVGARKFIWHFAHYWAKGWLFFIGMPLQVQGYFPTGKKFIIVANHISYMDTVLIYAAIPEYFRTLAKKEMVRIPLFGFIYKQLTILVDRSTQHSRTRSMRLMYRQLRNECHITIFPEGTFNESDKPLKEFYDGAFRLAINTQIPILPLLLPDTVHRWHYSAWWKLTPGRNRAIFLDPVFVNGKTIHDLEELKEKVFTMMEIGLKKAAVA